MSNEDDRSFSTERSGVADFLQHGLGVLIDRHLGRLALVPMARARVVAIRQYANVIEVAWQ